MYVALSSFLEDVILWDAGLLSSVSTSPVATPPSFSVHIWGRSAASKMFTASLSGGGVQNNESDLVLADLSS